MNFFGRISTLRRIAWLAIAAVAVNAFWPLVAQLKPAGFDPMAALCSEANRQEAQLGGKGDAPAEPAPLTPHCAFCTLAPGGFAVLSANGAVDAQPVEAVEFRPARREIAAPVLVVYSAARPRAPPAIHS